MRSGSSQASSTWAADPAVIGRAAPTGTVSRSPLARSAAATQIRASACLPVQLRALAGHVAQVAEDRLGHRQQPVLAGGRGQLGDPGPEDEPALGVAGHEPVMLQRDGDPVRGRPRQACRADELGERSGAGLHGAQHGNGLVQYADSARVVHVLILPSRYSRCNRNRPRGAGWVSDQEHEFPMRTGHSD